MRRKLVTTTTSNVVDLQTGEVSESSTTNVYRLPVEPPYVKLYLDDLCDLIKVPDSQKGLLLKLLKRLDFEGYILLTPRIRKDLAADMGVADQTFRNRLNDLCKAELLIRMGTNEYQANPKYFARGEWKTICARREAFELRITYSTLGRKLETNKLASGQASLDLGE
jgi:hypothetical protein